MKNIKLLLIIFFFLACTKKDKLTIIRGNISNLPDGTLYIYKDNSSYRIDSARTINGNFQIKHIWKEANPNYYLGIDHVDKKGVLRSFSFPTNAHYKDQAWESQFFMSDSLILINGKIKDFNLKDMKLSEQYKLVTSPQIMAGKQTEALFNIDADLFDNVISPPLGTLKSRVFC